MPRQPLMEEAEGSETKITIPTPEIRILTLAVIETRNGSLTSRQVTTRTVWKLMLSPSDLQIVDWWFLVSTWPQNWILQYFIVDLFNLASVAGTSSSLGSFWSGYEPLLVSPSTRICYSNLMKRLYFIIKIETFWCFFRPIVVKYSYLRRFLPTVHAKRKRRDSTAHNRSRCKQEANQTPNH